MCPQFALFVYQQQELGGSALLSRALMLVSWLVPWLVLPSTSQQSQLPVALWLQIQPVPPLHALAQHAWLKRSPQQGRYSLIAIF